jgi:hypothetical protein
MPTALFLATGGLSTFSWKALRMSMPKGSRYVNTDRPKPDLASANCQLLPSPSDIPRAGAYSIPRRGFLGSLTAALGFCLAPQQYPLTTLAGVVTGPAAERLTVTAMMSRYATESEPTIFRLYPTPAHATRHFYWRYCKEEEADPARSDRYHLQPQTLEFAGAGRCFAAVLFNVDLETGFRPEHLLDRPPMPPSERDIGLQVSENIGISDLTTRREALSQAANNNFELLTEGNELADGDDWWAVVEFGLEIEPSWIDIELTHGVGKADAHVSVSTRIVAPTAAEVSRFGKVGAL